jgi:hypothetical protein
MPTPPDSADDTPAKAETIEGLKQRNAKLEAALRAVEAWSFETVTDLTAAGYDSWAELIHEPRKPMTREERHALGDRLDELLRADGERRKFAN